MKQVAIFYQFMAPDDVVSAVHFHQLAVELQRLQWTVSAYPAIRGCRDRSQTYRSTEIIDDISYHRVWRPKFEQSKFLGRLANTLCMLLGWCKVVLKMKWRSPELIIVGTDPPFAVVFAWFAKLVLGRKTLILHWCFDLHPEASVAAGHFSGSSIVNKTIRAIAGVGYRSCDLIVDIGSCMRHRLSLYNITKPFVTVYPWALLEPDNFVPSHGVNYSGSEKGAIKVLYSGNYGQAHDLSVFDQSNRRSEPDIVQFQFSASGTRTEELKAICESNNDCEWLDPVPLSQLSDRLASADIHIVSVKAGWEGIVVPSKFFGSIASGRPILYLGSGDSVIADLIEKHNLGWIVSKDNFEEVFSKISELQTNPAKLMEIQRNCFQVYRTFFSRGLMVNILINAVEKNEIF